MEASERDTTDDWRVATERAPATVVELEGRIDVALATARSAEEAALEIGAASLEAAEQARRAAALAERASATASRAASEVAAAPRPLAAPAPPAVEPPPAIEPRAPVAEVASEPEVAVEPRVVAPPPEPERREPEAAPEEPAVAAVEAPPARHDFAPGTGRPDLFDERLTAFRERAESVMIRLRKLEAGTPPGNGPSEAAGMSAVDLSGGLRSSVDPGHP